MNTAKNAIFFLLVIIFSCDDEELPKDKINQLTKDSIEVVNLNNKENKFIEELQKEYNASNFFYDSRAYTTYEYQIQLEANNV